MRKVRIVFIEVVIDFAVEFAALVAEAQQSMPPEPPATPLPANNTTPPAIDFSPRSKTGSGTTILI